MTSLVSGCLGGLGRSRRRDRPPYSTVLYVGRYGVLYLCVLLKAQRTSTGPTAFARVAHTCGLALQIAPFAMARLTQGWPRE